MEHFLEGTKVKCDDGKIRKVVYRKTAIRKGLGRFFTGRPCKYGHIEERKTNSYICVKCARIKQKKRHKDKMLTDKEYRENFLKKRLVRHHERYKTEPEYRQKFIDRAKAYRSKQSNK